MKRTFLALDIYPDEHFRKDIEAIRRALHGGQIKWVDPDLLHLTLRFFGDTDEHDLALISDAVLKVTAEIHPFQLTLNSLGVFKNFRQPRVIWIGSDHPAGLKDLKKKVDDELTRQGFHPEDKAFSPHLTLGRIKSLSAQNRLAELLEHYRDFTFYQQFIPQIVLYESILRKEGPEYIQLKVFTLEGIKGNSDTLSLQNG
ncbi:MAG: RNA 2',3'-cyclic phosphodiesterase [Bacteroidales bacterium]|nr:RNA 2',3'-cyclic phosphodiesterase [Bacteroidales bacterium]